MAFKVVLVDDDLLVLQDLETLADWGKYGFTIAQTFTNGVAALRGIREIRPDFIVKLIRFHESLLLQCRRVRMISYLERKYQDKAYRDHQMILEGLKSGDSRLAQQALAGVYRNSKAGLSESYEGEEYNRRFWDASLFPLKIPQAADAWGIFNFHKTNPR